MLSVCVCVCKREIITSVPRCCFRIFERDRGCSTGCWKCLQAMIAWPWTPRVKVKQQESQMKRYEARHIMVQIQRDTIFNQESQPSRVRATF